MTLDDATRRQLRFSLFLQGAALLMFTVALVAQVATGGGAVLMLSGDVHAVVLQHSPAREFFDGLEDRGHRIPDLADEVALFDADGIKHKDHVIRELIDGIRSGRRAAAAVAAQIHPQHPITCGYQCRHLFRPHAEIGGKRMRESDDRGAIWASERANKVIGEIASNERQ